MSRVVGLVWLIAVVVVLALLGQFMGFYDVPLLRSVRLPFGSTTTSTVEPVGVTPSPAVVARPSPSPVAVASPAATACSAGRPIFVQGAADLKAALGAPMGDAAECERVVDAEGNTEQRTTSGLAYYRARANVVVFTNGAEHWALTPGGVVHWTSDEVEPPADAEPG